MVKLAIFPNFAQILHTNWRYCDGYIWLVLKSTHVRLIKYFNTIFNASKELGTKHMIANLGGPAK